MDQFHQYIKRYVQHFRLSPDIHLQHTVLKVHFIQTKKKFAVQIHDAVSSTIFSRMYDFVIVANGHFSKPYIPKIKGNFEGEMIHSHGLREFKPSLFKDKEIVIVGMRMSGIDTLTYVLKYYGTVRSLILVCDKADINSKHYFLRLKELSAFVHKERISEFAGGKQVVFSDGDIREVDTIFYCTGYEYNFPFLEKGVVQYFGKQGNSKGFGPLYLRSVHVDNPQLIFVGLVEHIPVIQYGIEWNSILAAQIALGRVSWSKKKLQSLYKEEIEQVRKYNPDLSRFHICSNKTYHYMTHIQRLKRACGVPFHFNFIEESQLHQCALRNAYFRTTNPISAKGMNFKDIKRGNEDFKLKSPQFPLRPKL